MFNTQIEFYRLNKYYLNPVNCCAVNKILFIILNA